ncbi:MAG: amidase, partial [Paracoccaceae bacterium]|nr:amidase [Paracoccaceae bacterium]
PRSDEDIAFSNLPDLAAWIRGGALSSRRLIEIYLNRIDRFDGKLFSFASVMAEQALEEADAMDRLTRQGRNLGPLHGIPYGVKDLFDTDGVTTGWGAEPYKDRVPDSDAAIVRKLREAGAVLLGKTAVGALAYGDIWYGGICRNPWNINEGSSGSSAGSASATAAGLCAFAIGTETLGSIVSPSNRCGVVGLRPTFGRVSRAGAMALCWSLDKVGPICRGAEDTALVLEAINGQDPDDFSSIAAPFHFDAHGKIEGLRVGYLPAAFSEESTTQTDHAALEAVRALGATVVEKRLPNLPYDALINLLFAEAAAAFEDLTLSDRDDQLGWQDEPAWPNKFRASRFLSAVDHVQLDRLRYKVMLALDALFDDIDILIGPGLNTPMLIASNFTGHPCLHLRAGFLDRATREQVTLKTGKQKDAKPGKGKTFSVPHGISLWGRLFDEGTIVRFGMALEKELDVASQRPGLGG